MESSVRTTPQLNYISSFFVNDTTLRNEEIEEVLFKNIANPVFKALHFLVDDEAASNRLHALTKDHPNAEKIKIVGVKKLLFSSQFEYAFTLKNELCMIANLDNYFLMIPEHFLSYIIANPTCIYTLSRHEHNLSCPQIDNYQGSHDAFIFLSPLNQKLLSRIAYDMTQAGIENILHYELRQLGYKLYNPCKDIICVHLDTTRSGRQKKPSINHRRNALVFPSSPLNDAAYHAWKRLEIHPLKRKCFSILRILRKALYEKLS